MTIKRLKQIPLNMFYLTTMERVGRRFKGFGKFLVKLKPGIGEELRKIEAPIEPEYYMFGSLLSAFFYGAIFFAITGLALTFRGEMDLETMQTLSLAVGFAFMVILFILHIIYPGIILKKIAAMENQDLLFSLREMVMEINGGVPLFEAMKNVAESDYGYISEDFEYVVKQIEAGVPQTEALRNLALKTDSVFLKKAVWQMINTLESGASMNVALPGIVTILEEHLIREIRDYSVNTNFLMLIYMLTAAAVPSLGITFLVLLSAFSGLGITVETIGSLIFISAVGQLMLIGYISVTRPTIFEG